MTAPAGSRGAAMMQWLLLLATILIAVGAHADVAHRQAAATIAIIIDDMGHDRPNNIAALELPGPVNYAFLPYTPHAIRLAKLAFVLDKEVLLHMPMESEHGRNLGEGGLFASMARWELARQLDRAVAAVPHARGMNNHMGSKLTARATAMDWVMSWMRNRRDLYFVDSRTSHASVALDNATRHGIMSVGRDVFLDHDKDPARIYAQFERLVVIAKARGSGVGIGHPHPETLWVLGDVLTRLDEYGVELVPVSGLLEVSD